MTQEQLELIELENAEAKAVVEKGEAFKSLLEDERWKLVITDGYLKEYPHELAEAIAMNTGAYDAEELGKSLQAINNFVQYGFRVAQNHTAALQTSRDNQELLESEAVEE